MHNIFKHTPIRPLIFVFVVLGIGGGIYITRAHDSGSPNITEQDYRWRGDTQTLNATPAVYLDGINTGITGVTQFTTYRLRIGVSNEGTAGFTNANHNLEYAEKVGGTCGDDETWVPMVASTGVTTEHFNMATSGQYATGDAITANHLTAQASTWVDGDGVEDTSVGSGNTTMAADTYTEHEFAIEANANATGPTDYCFRLNGEIDSWSVNYPELQTALINPNPPTGTFNSAAQKTDGSGTVDVSIEVADTGFQVDSKAKIEYQASAACNSWSDPTLDESAGATADFNDTGGSPSVVNTDTYQVGTTDTRNIVTSSGSNTVTFDWDSATDQGSGDGTMCLRLTVNDQVGDQTTPATQTLTVDNVNPTTPGSLTLNTKDTSSVTFNLGTDSSDTNDPGTNNYRLFYVAGASPPTENDTEFDSVAFDSWNPGATIQVTGLSSGTQYTFNIWAYDTYCQTSVANCTQNKAAAATPITVTTDAPPTPPTGSFNSASEKQDGTGVVDISVEINDVNLEDTKLNIGYTAGACTASQTSVGPYNGSTFTDEDYASCSVAWSTPSSVQLSDTSRSNANVTDTTTCTDWVQALDFTSFNIPTSATIDGIQVDVQHGTGIGISPYCGGNCTIQLVKGGTPVGSTGSCGSFSSGMSEVYGSAGGASSKWGTTWTANDINGSTFGARVRGGSIICGIGGTLRFTINHIRIKVWYTPVITWTDATLQTPITADYNDSGGAPDINNANPYQVGTTATTRVITSSGSNTVQFDWDSATDVPTGNGSYCLQLTANDDTEDQTTPATQSLTIDNVNPTAPGNLTESARSYDYITYAYGSQGNDTNSPSTNKYKMYWKQGTSGVTTSDSEKDSTDFDAWNYAGNSTIQLDTLTEDTQYVANIWSYDTYGHSNNASEINLKTRIRPTSTIEGLTEKTDGTGAVDVTVDVNSMDRRDTKLKFEFETSGSECDGPWAMASLASTTPAIVTYTDSGGVPDIDNSNAYQIGSTATTRIITDPSENTLQFDWNSKVDLPAGSGTYCVKVTVNDDLYDQTTSATQTLTIDNVVDTAAGNLTQNTINDTSIILNYGSQMADTNLPADNFYKIFYKEGLSDVNTDDTEKDSTDLDYQNYNSQPTITIGSLTASTDYVFNIWAYDSYGNQATSTEIQLTTTGGGNTAPTGIFTVAAPATQKSDGSGNVDISIDVDDAEDNDTKAAIKYASSCTPGSTNTGATDGSTFADDTSVGSSSWLNPSFAQTHNISGAVNTVGGSTSYYLKATDFGFSIPSGATIDGIQVDVERQYTLCMIGCNPIDEYARMVKGGSILGSDLAVGTPIPDTYAYKTFGSSSELWGLAWTPADINASNFGFVYSARETDGFSVKVSVDHIRITVYYTDAWGSASLTGTASAVHQDSGGHPDINNANPYQVGTTATTRIITSAGSNTVTFDWDSATDLPTGDGSYCLQLTANDDAVDQVTPDTVAVTIDNVAPTMPNLTVASETATSATLTFGDPSTETNFSRYRIYYSESSPVTTGDTEWTGDESTLTSQTYNSQPNTTVTGLSPNTTYYFNIWAYDDYGNSTAASGEVTTTSETQAIRSTEYYISGSSFSGTDYTLTLDQNLNQNHFILIRGGATTGGTPDVNYVRVDQLPQGMNGMVTATTSMNRIRLKRNAATNPWTGVITVVESLGDHSGAGFRTREVMEFSMGGQSGGAQSGHGTSTEAWADIGQVVPFGGYNGGGIESESGNVDTGSWDIISGWSRFYIGGADQVYWDRYDINNRGLESAIATTYIVEFGSEWTIQHVSVTRTNSGAGVDATGEYTTGAISSVTRNNTWLWSTGYYAPSASCSSTEGQAITLGDGVNQNASESTIAVGAACGSNNIQEVYVLTHPDLATDYRFKTDGDASIDTVDVTVDSASSGTRMGWVYHSSASGSADYPATIISARYTSDTNVRLERNAANAESGFAAWVQGIDFSAIGYVIGSYENQGEFTSASIDTDNYSTIKNKYPLRIQWNQSVPTGCLLRVYVRGSNTGPTPDFSTSTWAWSYASSTLTSVYQDLSSESSLQGKRFFQYRVYMESCQSGVQTPSINDLFMDFD